MKIKANFRAIKLGFALAVIVGSIPQTTLAGRQIIPGTECQVWGGDSNHADSIRYSQFGKVINANPDRRVAVVCPIPRLNQSNSANWIRVYIDDRNPSSGLIGSLSCRLRSNGAFGDQSVDTAAASTSSGFEDSGLFTFFGVTAAGGNSNFPYNYTMLCDLPAAYFNNFSSIGSIVIDERNSDTH